MTGGLANSECSRRGRDEGHQENAQSDRKRFQALPVLTVISKHIEARGIETQWVFLRAHQGKYDKVRPRAT